MTTATTASPLLARPGAVDGDGVPQTEETAPVAPNGAQGYPRRWIDV